MKSRERARRVLADMRGGKLQYMSPERSEAIIAEALREAKAHGAGMVLFLFRKVGDLSADDELLKKLSAIVEDMLRKDEAISSEPAA